MWMTQSEAEDKARAEQAQEAATARLQATLNQARMQHMQQFLA